MCPLVAWCLTHGCEEPDQGPPSPRPECMDFFDCAALLENNACSDEFMIANCPVTCNHCVNGTRIVTTAPPATTSASTTTTTTPNAVCADVYPLDCPQWAIPGLFSVIGECVRRPNWSKANCAKTCNRCGERIPIALCLTCGLYVRGAYTLAVLATAAAAATRHGTSYANRVMYLPYAHTVMWPRSGPRTAASSRLPRFPELYPAAGDSSL